MHADFEMELNGIEKNTSGSRQISSMISCVPEQVRQKNAEPGIQCCIMDPQLRELYRDHIHHAQR
ncbi:hypothetical protein MNBD_GAMMA14-1342 [hydrothermal vent metagenome]|uniref:Uncharacterized protein n=1 Tax=hydrothermal vent metagenome TaxID=652676 RepID=A0A3B0Z8Y4_9ZZZZ